LKPNVPKIYENFAYFAEVSCKPSELASAQLLCTVQNQATRSVGSHHSVLTWPTF